MLNTKKSLTLFFCSLIFSCVKSPPSVSTGDSIADAGLEAAGLMRAQATPLVNANTLRPAQPVNVQAQNINNLNQQLPPPSKTLPPITQQHTPSENIDIVSPVQTPSIVQEQNRDASEQQHTPPANTDIVNTVQETPEVQAQQPDASITYLEPHPDQNITSVQEKVLEAMRTAQRLAGISNNKH